MNAKEFKALLENKTRGDGGWQVVHVRRMPRSQRLTAYILTGHRLHPTAAEIRYDPAAPNIATLYAHAIAPNGYTQYDKYLTAINL